jgi:DNA-binding transcriptional ArsR family regulator
MPRAARWGECGVAAVEVLQALSDPARLRLLARIADAGEAGCALEAAAGDPRAARKQVARLSAAGLVEARGGTLVARLDRIRDAVDELAGEDDAAAGGPARVRALFSRGRLVEIPRAPELRLELLRPCRRALRARPHLLRARGQRAAARGPRRPRGAAALPRGREAARPRRRRRELLARVNGRNAACRDRCDGH